ncbi:MAG: nuclear transport factor 2 family protein [Vicinamibacterales bacterium]|jgi:ketosteroid isomerase-like protein
MGGPGELDVEARLKQAEQRIFHAIQARDLAALEAELDEAFVLSPIGQPEQDRPAFLAAIRDMPYQILEIHGEEIRVHALGEVALVSGIQRARVALPDNGAIVNAATAFVDAFVRSGAGWRLRHAVSVELPAAPEPAA